MATARTDAFRCVHAVVLALAVVELGCARDPRREEPTAPAESWTFAVISDLHVPRDGRLAPEHEHAIAAVLAARPRFLVITGDFTDGEPFDPRWRIREAPRWWRAVHQLLAPVRAAGIPILPVAGNHDSYLPIYRADYAATFRDLAAWAAPLRIEGHRQPAAGIALDAAPFCYSVDVDGVHLTFAHVVEEALAPEVARWIAQDLATARAARLRIVFGHVPLVSMATTPQPAFIASFGRILADGRADMYIAGHEHLMWDDDVAIPGEPRFRQLIVGTVAAHWRFAPSAAARDRARCTYVDKDACCTMPHDGRPFELRWQHGGWYEAQRYTLTLVTIAGRDITARALALRGDGSTAPFERAAPCRGSAAAP